MRVSRVLAFVAFACVCLPARAADPAPAASNVTVNFDALPVPMPRFKPSQDEMRPLAQSRPRPKPGIMAPIPDDATAEAGPEVLPTAAAAAGVPTPRAKPAELVAAVSPAAAPVPPPPATQPAAPPSPPDVPVAIVSKPVTDETFPVEITGTPYDPNATRTPVDPTAGFAILSRVRFSRTGSTLSPQAHSALDALAARLLSSRERVRLAAFSGKIGDDSSEARRLSLTRALAIRTYLVSKGVPVERVDVLAFGGPTQGVTDRVDVLVRGI